MEPIPFYVITGLSGAGKSQALRTFEDMGFFCVDNLPSDLVESFLDRVTERSEDRAGVAIVLDVRARDFLDVFPDLLEALDRDELEGHLLFIEASDKKILDRYQETRRPHPLGEEYSLDESVRREREMLEPVRERADFVFDTSETTIHQFRGWLRDLHHSDGLVPLTISFSSFGFKHGVPPHLDAMFDARFLPNPYYEEDLQEQPGTSPSVRNFLLEHEVVEEYVEQLEEMIGLMVTEYRQQGRPMIAIGIGCTGGQHRSVFLVDELKRRFEQLENTRAVLVHRDMRTVDVS